MKLTIPAIGVLATVLVLASVGVLYSNSYETGSGMLSSTSSMPLGTAYLTTNVKVTQLDENGNTIALRQGTNHITNTGMSIIMGQLFGGYDEDQATDTGVHGINGSYSRLSPGDYAANVTGRIGWMEIGTNGDDTWPDRLKYNNTDVANAIRGTCQRVAIEVSNFTQGNAQGSPKSCVNQDAVAGVGSARLCSAQMNVTATAQFTGANCATLSIDEAGIFTASTAECVAGNCGLMFARNIFGSVDLGALDTLQLEWEFTFTDS